MCPPSWKSWSSPTRWPCQSLRNILFIILGVTLCSRNGRTVAEKQEAEDFTSADLARNCMCVHVWGNKSVWALHCEEKEAWVRGCIFEMNDQIRRLSASVAPAPTPSVTGGSVVPTAHAAPGSRSPRHKSVVLSGWVGLNSLAHPCIRLGIFWNSRITHHPKAVGEWHSLMSHCHTSYQHVSSNVFQISNKQ